MFGTRRHASAGFHSTRDFRPEIEALEDRLALSWAGVPPATITLPNTYMAVTLNSSADAQGTAGIASNEVDYYRFTATTTGSYRIAASTPSSNLDPVLGVFNSSGNRIGYNDDISSTNTDSQLTVNLTTGVRYYFGITNYTGTPGGSYTWVVDGPAAVTDDAYEQNDSMAAAYNLGTLTSVQSVTGLRMRDGEDWFKFTQNGVGTTTDYVSINFTHAEGDLDLYLYNSAGTQVRRSDGTSNLEQVSLNGLASGTYYVRAHGYNGAQSSNYTLTIDPGVAASSPSGPYVLYLNFDGVSLARSALVRYAGTDWNANSIDPERNGIRVTAYLAGQSNRETIISDALRLVQDDLRPYGITVVRRTGLAVENQRATTIFVGNDNIRGDFGGLACDIDYGNNNRTDIAFVRSMFNTAQSVADTILHEAGHTYGLHHVYSAYQPEAMGMGYSTGTQAGMNVYFMNQTFNPYVDQYGNPHGDYPQNSHYVMYNTFVTGGGSLATSAGSTGSSAAHSHADHFNSAVFDTHESDHDHHHDSDQPHVEVPMGASHDFHRPDYGRALAALLGQDREDRRTRWAVVDAVFGNL